MSTLWAKIALVLLGFSMAGAVALVVDMVLGSYFGLVRGIMIGLATVTLWKLLPLRILHEGNPDELD